MTMEFTTDIAGKKLIVKTGEVAGQANGSCTVQYGETTVLATAVMGDKEQEGMDYFPLMVEYEERFYAAGKIKGSRFIKRETRPPDEAILIGRLIDRSIRPLFDQDMRRSVQVILTVLSIDHENDPDIPALLGASIALHMSNIPWNGPIAGVRIGQVDGELVVNPTQTQRATSNLDLMICGMNKRVLMIEAGAQEIEADVMYKAMELGAEEFEKINKFIEEIREKTGKPKMVLVSPLSPEDIVAKEEVKKITEEVVKAEMPKYFFDHPLKMKEDRVGAKKKLIARLEEVFIEKNIGKDRRGKGFDYAMKLIYQEISQAILDRDQRIDGRKLDELREISCQVGVLPRVHGSAIFSRGETQVLSVVTLGGPGMEQYLDTMEDSSRKRYMHHYNFPPFCSGEAGPLRQTGRREVGHGALAEKGILPILPDKENFPYTLRLVSEVLSSNGSTSMAATCASVLSSMDAGIPIKKLVSGIAVGLASEEGDNGFKKYKIITDIQDLEDGPGGMDFKIIGTPTGITAIQMDTKTKGLTFDVIKETFQASANARVKILEKMTQVMPKPRENFSPYAPRVTMIKINPDKIRDVVGPGGKVINEIVAQTGSTIDIEQDGTIMVTSLNEESKNKAIEWIKNITHEVKAGEIFQGKITRIMDFGAFAEVVHGQEGLIHVSEMANYRVEHPDDLVKVGDIVPVKVMEIDRQGRINLSMRALLEGGDQPRPADRDRSDRPRSGRPSNDRKRY